MEVRPDFWQHCQGPQCPHQHVGEWPCPLQWVLQYHPFWMRTRKQLLSLQVCIFIFKSISFRKFGMTFINISEVLKVLIDGSVNNLKEYCGNFPPLWMRTRKMMTEPTSLHFYIQVECSIAYGSSAWLLATLSRSSMSSSTCWWMALPPSMSAAVPSFLNANKKTTTEPTSLHIYIQVYQFLEVWNDFH